jgi:hypothetical protein
MSLHAISSGFYLNVVGEVVGIQQENADNLYVKYSMQQGLDWSVVHVSFDFII